MLVAFERFVLFRQELSLVLYRRRRRPDDAAAAVFPAVVLFYHFLDETPEFDLPAGGRPGARVGQVGLLLVLAPCIAAGRNLLLVLAAAWSCWRLRRHRDHQRRILERKRQRQLKGWLAVVHINNYTLSRNHSGVRTHGIVSSKQY